jgi:hypothetical protein
MTGTAYANQGMTSQEFEIRRKARVARTWTARRKRWAAWKEKQREHGMPNRFGLTAEQMKEQT